MTKYKFEDIVFNATQKKKPVEEDKYTYLGLEHLDPGNLTVSRFGSDVAPKGEKLIMKKGDVLFGKRRAYQKKVAIAPFDGIFSAHGMVLRPKTEIIDEKFFPFFISSDYFLDTAIQISVGSLSPTVNWGTLKNIEFNLPELNTQAKLADLLWAATNTKEAYKKLLILTDDIAKSQFIEMFGDEENNPKGYNVARLGDVASYINGFAFKPADWGLEGLPIIRIQNLTGTNDEYNYYDGKYPERIEVNDGDVLISWSASLGVYLWTNGKALLNQHIFKVKFDKMEIDKIYFMYAVKRKIDEMVSKAHGSTMKHIVKKDFENTKILLPSIQEQKEFALFLQNVDKSKLKLQKSISSLENSVKSLIRRYLG